MLVSDPVENLLSTIKMFEKFHPEYEVSDNLLNTWRDISIQLIQELNRTGIAENVKDAELIVNIYIGNEFRNKKIDDMRKTMLADLFGRGGLYECIRIE